MTLKKEQFKIIFDENANVLSCKGDCDCACIHSVEKTNVISTALRDFSDYKQRKGLLFQPLDDEFTFVMGPQNHRSRAVLNSAAYYLLMQLESQNPLHSILKANPDYHSSSIYDVLLVLENLYLIEPVGDIDGGRQNNFQNASSDTRVLNAWLHTTNACNMRCSYCFLDKSGEKMSVETGFKSIDAIFRSAKANGFKQVKVKYAGGEPTLDIDLITQLHRYASDCARLLDINYIATILSNGTYVSDKFIKFLEEDKIDLMISLDGIEEFHDKQRFFKNGKGSFGIIDQNISKLLSRNIKPFITVTITSQTAPGLPPIISYLLDRDLPFTLNFYRSSTYSEIRDEQLSLCEEIIIRYMKETYKLIENRMPSRSLLGSLLDLNNASTPHQKNCGVGENYLVIDQIGRISKCHMDIENPVTTIDIVDPLRCVIDDVDGIQNYTYLQKSGCKNCEWGPWCAGGCPLVTYKAHGRYDVKSPNCNIYKSLYPYVLRLEGLRLLKYFSD